MLKNKKNDNQNHSISNQVVEIIIEEGIISIPDNCFQDLNVTSIQLPNSLISIGKKAFESCKNLFEITIPSKVNTLQEETFYSCESLTRVTVEGNLSSIGESCFENDSKLEFFSLKNCSNPPKIEKKTFNDGNKKMKVEVSNPSEYKSNKEWKVFF